MKNFYFAVTVKENNKYYAYVIKANTSSNLKSTFNNPKFDNIAIFQTKKKAEETATYWNVCFKANGTYYFDEPLF